MTTIVAGIAYDGSRYHGWQEQAEGFTVEGSLRLAIRRALGFEARCAVAGRTDQGVHATLQFVQIELDDMAPGLPETAWLTGVNARLPADIRILWVRPLPEGFHVRHSARGRRYRYIIDTRQPASVFATRYAWQRFGTLDLAAMDRASHSLLGEHDFSAYRSSWCQSPSPVRRLDLFQVQAEGGLLLIDLGASGFLHHMVRNLVGTLVEVGTGKRGADNPREVLEGRDRRRAGPTAPAAGLYFCGALYDPALAFPDPLLPGGVRF